MATVEILKQVEDEKIDGGWQLCFQSCIYHLDDNETKTGYRFIWRKPDGKLQAARGQARIPDAATLIRLTEKAKAEGWLR